MALIGIGSAKIDLLLQKEVYKPGEYCLWVISLSREVLSNKS